MKNITFCAKKTLIYGEKESSPEIVSKLVINVVRLANYYLFMNTSY